MDYSYAEFTPIIKAISDETRLKIIDMLSCEQMYANELLEKFNITQPTLSYHMKILNDVKIVTAKKEGIWVKYRLNKKKLKVLIDFLGYISNEKEECICHEKKKDEV